MYHSRLTSALAMAALAAILVSSTLPAQITFQRTYGGPDCDEGYSVRQTADGGYIITGRTGPLWSGDVYLIKTGALGETLWTRKYGGNDDDYGLSVGLTADGGYIICGFTYSFGAGADDLYLIRTDAGGDTLWARAYGGSGPDAGFSVQQTADGGFIASGFGDGDWEEAYLVKTNALGDTQWTRMFPGMNWDGTSVQQTADSGYIVAGTTGGDAYLLKYDANGDTQWTRTYSGGRTSYGLSVRQTADGGYIVAGRMDSGTDYNDVYVIRTDGNGQALWTKTFGGTNHDEGLSVQQVADGGYIVVGYTRSYGAGGSDAYVLRLDGNGDTLWTKIIGGPNGDCATSVQLTTDGGYVIAGYTGSFGAGGVDVWLIKTDSLGNVAVAEPKASPTRAPALSLACTPNPATGTTTIHLTPFASRLSPFALRIYDAQGCRVRTFTVNREPCTVWDGKDDFGQPLPSGAYFVRCDVAGEHATTRIVLQR